jgi:hypothetical protein
MEVVNMDLSETLTYLYAMQLTKCHKLFILCQWVNADLQNLRLNPGHLQQRRHLGLVEVAHS